MTRIDRYVLTELGKRLIVALGIVLISLVVERVLRLFDLVSMKGGPIDLVWQMALMLVPHYLGLALPAGFFVSIFLSMSRFHHDSEFDALLAAGISPSRFARPFIAASVVLALVSLGVFGYAQPYTRYGYRAIMHLVMNIPWNAQIPEMSFSRVEKDATVTADRTSASGELEKVFVHYFEKDAEITVVAGHGTLSFGPMRSYYELDLDDAQRIEIKPGEPPSVGWFQTLTVRRPIARTIPAFRERGDDVRELTLDELRDKPPSPNWTRAETRAEFHSRVVRSLSVVFLPFLAIPLALASRRTKRSAGIVLGAVLLLITHYTMQTLQGMAALGRVPVVSMWLVMAAFGAISGVLFWRAQRHPGENPLDPAFVAIDLVFSWVRALAVVAWRKVRPA